MIPVHNHSMYSALDGFSKPEEIADRIADIGLPGAFLTDHGTVAGWNSFAKAMKKKDLFAGFGMEAYQAKESRKERGSARNESGYHLILLASNMQGYRNLQCLADESNRTGFYYVPRVDWELLEKYNEGIVATSACLGSLICRTIDDTGSPKPIDRFLKIFGDRFMLELNTYKNDQQVAMNEELVEIAEERGIPFIYANDAHYARDDQWMDHEAFLCMQYGTWLGADKTKKRGGQENDGKAEGIQQYSDEITRFHPQCLYIMDEEDVRERLNYLGQDVVDSAISNTDLLMEMCQFDITPKTLHLPKSHNKNARDLFIDLVEEGTERKYGPDVPDEVWERVQYELKAVLDAELHDYFLIVQDYVKNALDKGKMVGPGRGSVGGTILANVLDITTIDPLKYNLQFERFWNPGRAEGLPDIDIDFSREVRNEQIEYVEHKYGPERVLRIGNHILLWPKSAIDKAAMVLWDKGQVPYGAIYKIKEIIETTTDAGKLEDWDTVMEMVGDELDEYVKSYPLLFELAKNLSGRLASYGIHASAVVISDVDLPEFLPSRLASDEDKDKVLVTQAEMHQVEDLGFPKFDFLGLRNLDTVARAAFLSGEFGDNEETPHKIVNFLRREVDYDAMGEEAFQFLDRGLTLGLFQVEEGNTVKRLARQIQPRSIEDLALLVALNKPGPLRGGETDRFIKRRNGEDEVSYPHEILEDILDTTLGIFVYQEQVIAYFTKIGYSLSDADHIRKVMGKKLVDEMKEEFPKYMERAEQYMSKATAKRIWDLIVGFSKYGFNKAHAVGYALILAWTIYAKYRWPLEFIMASIETNPKKLGGYINEARRMNIEVLPPSVNDSGIAITKSGEKIFYGLVDIKGIGYTGAEKVVATRPYESIEDYVERCAADSGIRKKLMAAGAFDFFGYRLGDCITCEGKGKVRREVLNAKGDKMINKSFPCDDCFRGLQRIEIPPVEERVIAEEEFLGIALTDLHSEIIEKFADKIASLEPFALAQTDAETTVKIPGIITEVKKTRTRSDLPAHMANQEMAHIGLEWQGETIRVVAFPKVYEAFSFMLKPRVIGEFTIKTSPKGGQITKAFKYMM